MKRTEKALSEPPESSQRHAESSSTDPIENRYNFKIGIYGWRKRCLYALMLGLLIVVIVNLALTLWVLKVMEFSSEGMGQLKIISNGLRMDGKAFIMDRLIASNIRSRPNQPVVLESSSNFTLVTRKRNGQIENLIYLGDGSLECLADNFKIVDDRGSTSFSVNNKEVLVNTESLSVTGEGGTVFSGSIKTPMVRAESGHDLKLESPTSSIDITAAESINLDSYGGAVRVVSQNDISLKSTEGSVVLQSENIRMPFLPVPKDAQYPHEHQAFQMCVCHDGKIFLASAESTCLTHEHDLICR